MSKFTFTKTDIPGMFIVDPTTFGDARGWFMESYQRDEFAAAGITADFVQDNQSFSSRGVLRGLHFQKEHTQGKLVQVVAGRVFDVGVDVRPGSPAFGKWVGAELTSENHRMLYVPEGCAHGFVVLSENAHFSYKCTDLYHPASEGGVLWNDADIGIEWPLDGIEPLLSDKDRALPRLAEQDFSFFEGWKP